MSKVLRRMLLVFPAVRRIREQLHHYDAEIRRLREELRASNSFLAEKSFQLAEKNAQFEEFSRQRSHISDGLVKELVDKASAAKAEVDEVKAEYARLQADFAELEEAYREAVEVNSGVIGKYVDAALAAKSFEPAHSAGRGVE